MTLLETYGIRYTGNKSFDDLVSPQRSEPAGVPGPRSPCGNPGAIHAEQEVVPALKYPSAQAKKARIREESFQG